MTCDGKNFVGWPCDEKQEALRQQYIQETDPEKQKALVEAMHRRLWEVVPYVPLGQLKQPFLWRKNISGVLKANTLVFLEHRKKLKPAAEPRDIDVAQHALQAVRASRAQRPMRPRRQLSVRQCNARLTPTALTSLALQVN